MITRIISFVLVLSFSSMGFADSLHSEDQGRTFFNRISGQDTIDRVRFENSDHNNARMIIGYAKLKNGYIDAKGKRGNLVRFKAYIQKYTDGYWRGVGTTQMQYANGTVCHFPIELLVASQKVGIALKAKMPSHFPIEIGDSCPQESLYNQSTETTGWIFLR